MIKPLQDYIILEDVKTEVSTKIMLTGNEDIATPPVAIVVATNDEHSGFQLGTKVLYQQHLFEELEWEGKKIKIGRESGIIGLC